LQHRMPSSGAIVHSTADLRQIGDAPVTVLVLDEINTPFTDMAVARAALERYLKSQPEVLSEPTTLLFVDNKKLDVIHDYTQDRMELQQSLKKHFPDYPWQLTVNSGDKAMVPRMMQTLKALLQISEATRGIHGRKNVIWVGKGFPSVDVAGTDPASTKLITDAIKKTTFALLGAKVSVFTIDPAFLDPTPVTDEESDSGMAAGDLNGTGLVFGGAIQFSQFAGSTGGHAFSMSNDVDAEIANSISDGANYYELNYTPTSFSQDPTKYRKIAVSVRRPGLTVITRDGYFPPVDTPVEPAKKQAEVLDQIKFDLSSAAMSKLVYDSLEVTAQRSSPNQYAVSVETSGVAWKENAGGHIAELSIMAVCFSAKDKPLSNTSSEHTAKATGDVTKATGTITYQLPMTLPAGSSRIRFVVRDLTSGKMGSVDIKLP
jgi:VWFA-related protein